MDRAAAAWRQQGPAVQAAISRALVLACMAVMDWLIPDYDSSSGSGTQALAKCIAQEGSSKEALMPRWPLTAASLEGLAVWDAVFFLRISQCGYEYDKFHAFFPGLPAAMWLLKETVLSPLAPLLGERGALVASGLLLSNVSFVLAAVALHRLSLQVLGSPRMAGVSVAFFCWNPASVFFSSVYTESIYAMATFCGMLAVESGYLWVAVAAFTATASIRSNGVLNAGYLLHAAAVTISQAACQRRWGAAAWTLGLAIAGCATVWAPLVGFQWVGYRLHCAAAQDQPVWCHDKLPYIYGHVQKEYWGVGFLRYFEIKQVPNFALASPVLALSFAGVWSYLSSDWQRSLRLGVLKPPPKRQSPGTCRVPPGLFFRDKVLVYVFHWAALSLVALLVMHVQVATRFLSSSPPLFWYMAHLWTSSPRSRKLLAPYCSVYCALGIILHPNFYPWT